MISRSRSLMMGIALLGFAAACSDSSTAPALSGGSASLAQGSSGGGSGGGTPTPVTGVITYTTINPAVPISTFIGWGLTGMQATGFFDDFAEQFTAEVTGSMASVRYSVQQSGVGGNGSLTVLIYSDNVLVPNTVGDLVGAFQGRSTKSGGASSALSTIAISNGPRLLAGATYWFKVVPSSESRMVWYPGSIYVPGYHFYEDTYSSNYWLSEVGGDGKAAFEVRVIQ